MSEITQATRLAILLQCNQRNRLRVDRAKDLNRKARILEELKAKYQVNIIIREEAKRQIICSMIAVQATWNIKT
jgi:hypothetical protein